MAPVSKVLFVLVLAPALAAVSAATVSSQKTDFFMNWVAQRSDRAGAASYYGEVETTNICMKETVVDGCSCYGRRVTKDCPTGSCYSFTLDVEMACCDKHDSDHLSALVKEAISAGKCTYTQSYTEEPVDVTKGDSSVQKIGEFTGLCTLNQHADTCGEPACEDMTLTILGDVYFVKEVAFEAPLNNPSRSAKCVSIFGGDCQQAHKVTATKMQYGYDPEWYHKEHEHESYERPSYPDQPSSYDRKPTFYANPGLAFIGTFSVTSRAHATEYETGIYELVEAAGQVNTANPLTEPPAGAYVARASEVNFKFLKNKVGYKA